MTHYPQILFQYLPLLWLVPTFIFCMTQLGAARLAIIRTEPNIQSRKQITTRNYKLAKVDMISFASLQFMSLLGIGNSVATVLWLLTYNFFITK